MSLKPVPIIFEEISKAKTHLEKVKILKNNRNSMVDLLLELTFSKNLAISLPEGKPPYLKTGEADLFNATLSTTYVSSSDTIMRFGKKKDVSLIKQYAEIDSIAWKEINEFHVDQDSKKVIQSSQVLHPRLSRVNIEFYYKF